MKDPPKGVSIREEAPTERVQVVGTTVSPTKILAIATQVEDVAGNLEGVPVAVSETEKSLEQVIPTRCLPPIIFQAGPSELASSILSMVENLQSTMNFLRSFLSPAEKLYIVSKGLRSGWLAS